jgi:hypothetical protein
MGAAAGGERGGAGGGVGAVFGAEVNRMLSGVAGFYEFQARRGSTLAQDLVMS